MNDIHSAARMVLVQLPKAQEQGPGRSKWDEGSLCMSPVPCQHTVCQVDMMIISWDNVPDQACRQSLQQGETPTEGGLDSDHLNHWQSTASLM